MSSSALPPLPPPLAAPALAAPAPAAPAPAASARPAPAAAGSGPALAGSCCRILGRILGLILGLILAGCASRPVPSVYQYERFDLKSTSYARHFGESVSRTCDAARRALLSQGYIITEPRDGVLTGLKSFQPQVEAHIQIDFTVYCIGEQTRPDRGATAFVSAMQERYALKKSSSSASVGVGPVGSISLPFVRSDEAMIKVASETIASSAFYERFFALVEHYLVFLDDEEAPDPPAEADMTPPAMTDLAPTPPPSTSPSTSPPLTPMPGETVPGILTGPEAPP